MGVEYGTVINKTDPTVVKKSGPVKAAVKLLIGLVYQDGANGWTNAPVDGSILAKNLYWNTIELDNTAGAKGDKAGTFYGLNSKVVGKADGAIALNDDVRASQTAVHNGQFEALAVPAAAVTPTAAEVNAIRTYIIQKVGGYLGHVGEYLTKDGLPTAATDEQTNIVIQMTGGYA